MKMFKYIFRKIKDYKDSYSFSKDIGYRISCSINEYTSVITTEISWILFLLDALSDYLRTNHEYYIERFLNDEVKDWLNTNCHNRWHAIFNIQENDRKFDIIFKCARDATLFKLIFK